MGNTSVRSSTGPGCGILVYEEKLAFYQEMDALLVERSHLTQLLSDLLTIAEEQNDTETKNSYRSVLNNLIGRLSRVYYKLQTGHLAELAERAGKII